jgi:hypothetical protein
MIKIACIFMLLQASSVAARGASQRAIVTTLLCLLTPRHCVRCVTWMCAFSGLSATSWVWASFLRMGKGGKNEFSEDLCGCHHDAGVCK